MRIAHVGPPLARTGGPAGYLLALQRASCVFGEATRHELEFPAAAPARNGKRGPSVLRSRIGRAKRAILGPPRFYRPSPDELKREGGAISKLLENAEREAVELCRPMLSSAADVSFVHDVFAAQTLSREKRSAELWLMIHSPMPIGLYLAWNWGMPEWSWEQIADLPDVRKSIEDELALWGRVDRIILPCAEALEELARIDPRFAAIGTRIEYLLTGSATAVSSAESTLSRDEPLGVYLGSNQPYRGLDVLLQAVELLPSRSALPGTIAIAGPDPDTIPAHPRLRRLGRVEDVPALLAGADFLVNTNRFSLFDLSNIEAAAAGRAMLLHAVGGNKTLAKLGAGCRLFEPLTPEVLARALIEMLSARRDSLAELGRRSRACYERHLTGEAMWRRHRELYDRAEVRTAV